MIYVFLAQGFEEIEALAVVDILRRAELEVVTVGIGGRIVTGAHGIAVAADLLDQDLVFKDLEMVVLPGGMPGTLNLEKSPVVQHAVDCAAAEGKWLCAICAAPSILGHKGLLEGKAATCFPGFESQLFGARYTGEPVTVDGLVITGKGPGAAIAFGLELVARLKGRERSNILGESMQCAEI